MRFHFIFQIFEVEMEAIQLFKNEYDKDEIVEAQAIVLVIGPKHCGKSELIKHLTNDSKNHTLSMEVQKQRITNVKFHECENLENTHNMNECLANAFKIDMLLKKHKFAQILLMMEYDTTIEKEGLHSAS
jgi:ABC-type branched-subunit amino acid transport system ATPase component